MGILGELLKHPEDIPALVKLKLAARNAKKQVHPELHWFFCYALLCKVSRSFALVIQLLNPQIRDAVCVLYLILRALDTIEDDTRVRIDIKVPILLSFHQHIYDRRWRFPCGTEYNKVLMNQFYHVVDAFLELERGHREVIDDITRRMGIGMTKFICKEVETVDDYDEYCHHVAGLVGLALSKLFYTSQLEDFAPNHLSNSMGLFLQKTNIIRDYLEDINEIPISRMFWPREIWYKYAAKLEDFKYVENSSKAVECLNEMVTNALTHVEDCLKYMSALQDPSVFRFCAIPQVIAIGTLAQCYNNVEVFRGVVKMRRGLAAKVIDYTRTMPDVYGAFYDFSCILQAKIDANDPNATRTKEQVARIQEACLATGMLSRRKCYINESKPNNCNPVKIFLIILLLAILFGLITTE